MIATDSLDSPLKTGEDVRLLFESLHLHPTIGRFFGTPIKLGVHYGTEDTEETTAAWEVSWTFEKPSIHWSWKYIESPTSSVPLGSFPGLAPFRYVLTARVRRGMTGREALALLVESMQRFVLHEIREGLILGEGLRPLDPHDRKNGEIVHLLARDGASYCGGRKPSERIVEAEDDGLRKATCARCLDQWRKAAEVKK